MSGKAAANDGSEYLEFVTPMDSSKGDHALLAELAEKQALAAQKVAEAKAALATAENDLRDLNEKQIPEVMDRLGLKEVRTTTGLKVTVKEDIRASISEERMVEAFDWLRKNNHAAVIKNVLTLTFDKNEDAKAAEAIALLKGKKFIPVQKLSVHAQTLAKLVRDRLEEGQPVAMDLLGVHRQRVAHVSTK